MQRELEKGQKHYDVTGTSTCSTVGMFTREQLFALRATGAADTAAMQQRVASCMSGSCNRTINWTGMYCPHELPHQMRETLWGNMRFVKLQWDTSCCPVHGMSDVWSSACTAETVSLMWKLAGRRTDRSTERRGWSSTTGRKMRR